MTSGEALVRISIGEDKYISWSCVGTDCKKVNDPNEATMNLAFGVGLEDYLIKGDILRSFGQMLGLELEHRHIDVVKTWSNIEVIKSWWGKEFGDIPWETFRKLVIDPIADGELSNLVQTDYDENSIMIWEFPTRPPVVVFNEGYTMKSSFNTTLSANDKDFINKLYTAGDRYIVLSPLDHTVATEGETFDLTVKSNTSWTLTKPDWCTLSESSGSGNVTIKVTVADNGGSTIEQGG